MTAPPELPRAYWTLAEVAMHWRVTERTVANWIARGEMTAVQVGGRKRIASADALRGPKSKEA